MHIPALGESATVDIRYMKKFDEPANYYKFEKDISGNALKYRVLIQNNAVRSILYNFKGKIRELECVTYKYKVGEIVNIKTLGLDNIEYAKIASIPIQSLASLNQDKLSTYERTPPKYELEGSCKSRYFEELLGYIDVELIPNVEEKPMNIKCISIPICECKGGIEEHRKGLEIINGWKNKIKEKCMDLIKETNTKIDFINSQEYENISVTVKEEMLDMLQKMEGELITLGNNALNNVDPVTQSLNNRR